MEFFRSIPIPILMFFACYGVPQVLGVDLSPFAAATRNVRRRTAMIFQHFNLCPHLTALQNVMLAPRVVHGETRPDIEARARAWFDKVRLAHRINACPAQLCGGEQQRVAIARSGSMFWRAILWHGEHT